MTIYSNQYKPIILTFYTQNKPTTIHQWWHFGVWCSSGLFRIVSLQNSSQGSSGRRRPRRPGSLKLSFPSLLSCRGRPSFRLRPSWSVSKLLRCTAGVSGRKQGLCKSRMARALTSCGGLILVQNRPITSLNCLIFSRKPRPKLAQIMIWRQGI